jgi:hypothetical protein
MSDDDMHDHGLTLKQHIFAETYLQNGGVGTEAALAAGYNPNPDTIKTSASHVLHHPKVRAYMRARVSGLIASTDEALAELTMIGMMPIENFLVEKYNSKGVLVDARIMLADKVRALELIIKFQNGEKEQNPVDDVCRILSYVSPFERKE